MFDAVGRVIWSRDGDGFLRYTEYDAQTGAVVKSIVDVDTWQTADFLAQSLPTGWLTPTGGGLHLVTTHEVDRLGRITKAIDPNGNVTFTVYDDVNHSTRTSIGWNASTLTPTGPIQVSRRDLSGTYTESLTYSAVPAVDAQGRPTGTELITSMQSLTRSLMNAAGQVIAVDRYTNLDGLAYSTATATLGLHGENFLRTLYAYNNQGQVDRLQNPAGTITISMYDGLARLTATYVGTDDSTTDGFKWTPSNASATSNMAQVSANEYDNGGVGNGSLTKSTLFPGGGAAPRITENAYDWRNRLVATKTGGTGSLATEDLGDARPDHLDGPPNRVPPVVVEPVAGGVLPAPRSVAYAAAMLTPHHEAGVWMLRSPITPDRTTCSRDRHEASDNPNLVKASHGGEGKRSAHALHAELAVQPASHSLV